MAYQFEIARAFVTLSSKGDFASAIERGRTQLDAMKRSMADGSFGVRAKQMAAMNTEAEAIGKKAGFIQRAAEIGRFGASLEKVIGPLGGVKAGMLGMTASVISAGIQVLTQKVAALGQAAKATGNHFARLSAIGAASLIGAAAVYSPVAMIQFGFAARDLAGIIGRELVPFLERLTAIVRNIADRFASLPPEVRKIIATLAVVGVVGAGVVGVVFKIVGAVAGLITIIGALNAALALLNIESGGILIAIGVLVTGTAALATALAGLGTYIGTTREGAAAFNSIFQGMGGVLQQFKDVAMTVWNAIKPALQEVGASLMESFQAVATALGDAVASLKPFAASVGELIGTLIRFVGAATQIGGGLLIGGIRLLGQAWQVVSGLIMSGVNAISGALKQLLGAMMSLGASLMTFFKNIDLTTIFSALLAPAMALIHVLITGFTHIVKVIAAAVAGLSLLLDAMSDPGLLRNFSGELRKRMGAADALSKRFTAQGPPTTSSVGAGGGGTASFSSVAEVQRKAQLSALMTPSVQEKRDDENARNLDRIARGIENAAPWWQRMADGIGRMNPAVGQ